MPELKDIAIKKWIGDFSGVAPTLSTTDGISVGDVAVDNSTVPYTVWRCLNNTTSAPVWVRQRGEYVKIITSVSYNLLVTDWCLLIDSTASITYSTIVLPEITNSFENIPFTVKFIRGAIPVKILPYGTELFESLSEYILTTLYDYVTFIAKDGKWYIINKN